jgi:hypothetical protein
MTLMASNCASLKYVELRIYPYPLPPFSPEGRRGAGGMRGQDENLKYKK